MRLHRTRVWGTEYRSGQSAHTGFFRLSAYGLLPSQTGCPAAPGVAHVPSRRLPLRSCLGPPRRGAGRSGPNTRPRPVRSSPPGPTMPGNEEVVPNIANTSFHPAFFIASGRCNRAGFEPVVRGQIQQAGIELMCRHGAPTPPNASCRTGEFRVRHPRLQTRSDARAERHRCVH